MNDASVPQSQFDYFAEVARADAENQRAAELASARAPYSPGRDLGKISGLPSNPLDPSTAKLEYEQGAYKYDGHYGQPVWSDGQIIGYDFVKHDATPEGYVSVIRTDASGNIADQYMAPPPEDQDVLGTVLQFAPVLLMAVPGAGLALGQSLLGAGASQATATALGNAIINGAISEGTGGDFLKGAALSYAGSAIPGLDAVKEGSSYLSNIDPSGTLSKAFTGAVTSGGRALLSGQDIGDAMLAGATSGGVSGAVGALTSNIEGFSDLTPAQQRTVNSAITGVLSGKPLDQVAINAAISTAKNEINSLTAPKASDFESGSFKYDQVFDPKTAGMVDMSEQSFDPSYQFTTDFGLGADYSLGPKSDGQGFQITAPPEVFNPDGSVNYDLLDYDQLARLGFTAPDGQNIGDENSFINQPAPGGDISIQGALDAGAKAIQANLNKSSPSASGSKSQGAPGSGVDLNALMAILGGRQQAPTVVSSGQDNSADIELMQDIFGTSLSAPSAGNTDTRENEFARLLRS